MKKANFTSFRIIEPSLSATSRSGDQEKIPGSFVTSAARRTACGGSYGSLLNHPAMFASAFLPHIATFPHFSPDEDLKRPLEWLRPFCPIVKEDHARHHSAPPAFNSSGFSWMLPMTSNSSVNAVIDPLSPVEIYSSSKRALSHTTFAGEPLWNPSLTISPS